MARLRQHEDSLELLLDTICNTFGGILFLALLVCMLAQNTRPRETTSAEADAALAKLHESRVAESELDEANREVASLEQIRAQQLEVARSLGQGAAGAGVSVSARDLSALRVRRQVLRGEQQDLTAALERSAREKTRLVGEVDAVRAAVQQAEHDAAEAADDLKEVRRQKAVTLRLPKARPTSKRQIAVLISGGRLRIPFRYTASGRAADRNVAEIRAAAPSSMLGPEHFVPGSGTRIEDTEPGRRSIDDRFADFDPIESYVCVALWPDSYPQFKVARDHLVKKGFDYQVILMEADGAITLGSGGSGEVQ